MVKTTSVWVSFSEENQKLLIYQMFHGFLQTQNMVNLVSSNAAPLVVSFNHVMLQCYLRLLCVE